MTVKRLLYIFCLFFVFWIIACESPVSTEIKSGELSRTESLYSTTNEIYDPAWSPDGERIAFVSKNPAGDLYKISADGDSMEKIARLSIYIRTNLCAISPDEQYVVYSDHNYDNRTGRRNTYLYSAALDAELLFNDPTPTDATLFKWSRDSRVIYSYSYENLIHTIRAVTPEGDRVFSVVLDSTASFSDYSVAPDGQSIAWANKPDDQKNWQIWLYTPANGQQKLIAANSVDAFHPSWSPDGNSIAYQAYNKKTANRTLDIYSFGNHSSRTIVENINWFEWIVWSDDGQTIYINGSLSNPPGSGIWAISLPDSSISLNYQLTWSRILQVNSDGSFYDYPKYSSYYFLYSVGVADKKLTRLVAGVEEQLSHPTWAPDGTSLVFTKDRTLCRVSAGGGEPEPLDIGYSHQYHPDFSPDGSLIVFDNGYSLFTVPANGGPVIRISSYDYNISDPVWSPDGKQIACARHSDDMDSLMVFNYTDEKLSRAKAWPGYCSNITWSKSHPVFGSHLLYIGSTNPDEGITCLELKARNPENDQLYTLIGETGSLFNNTPDYLGACWSPDPETIAWIQNYNRWGNNRFLNIARIFVDLQQNEE